MTAHLSPLSKAHSVVLCASLCLSPSGGTALPCCFLTLPAFACAARISPGPIQRALAHYALSSRDALAGRLRARHSVPSLLSLSRASGGRTCMAGDAGPCVYRTTRPWRARTPHHRAPPLPAPTSHMTLRRGTARLAGHLHDGQDGRADRGRTPFKNIFPSLSSLLLHDTVWPCLWCCLPTPTAVPVLSQGLPPHAFCHCLPWDNMPGTCHFVHSTSASHPYAG